MFLHLFVILFTERVFPSGPGGGVWVDIALPGRHAPGQSPPPPRQIHGLGQTPLRVDTPWAEPTSPPPHGHWSGRYASYWNAFLF